MARPIAETPTHLEILQSRHSVRSYSNRPLEEDVRNKLRSVATFINTHEAGLNFQLCFDDPEPFKGMGRSYGMFRNVNNYLAVIVDPSFSDVYERAGYFGEQFVIEALKLGIGSCFVKATYDAKRVAPRMGVYEKLPFVVTLGYPEESKTTLGGKLTKTFAHLKKMQAREFFGGSDAEYEEALKCFPQLPEYLEAIACAPSAYNKRPARLAMQTIDGQPELVVTVPDETRDAIEKGIARFNLDYLREL